MTDIDKIRVNGRDIQVGQPLARSVYSRSGELLLKKGRAITTSRQKDVLMQSGYFLNSDIESEALFRQSVMSIDDLNHVDDNDVFDVKNGWIEELYDVFNLIHHSEVVNFRYRILKLAVEMQCYIENHHDALLAAFQMDHENHYGLVHALFSATTCEMIAKSVGLTQIERLGIIAGALTHDIGIVEMQDKLHLQETSLSDEQWKLVRGHPKKSYDTLLELEVDDPVWLNIAHHHHERLDGSGYPEGLKGDQLSIAVRIMCIADMYTAIIRPTVFRSEKSGKKALTILYKERGTCLDAELIDLFIKEIGIFPLGSLVRLQSNEVAVVVKRGKTRSKPIVLAVLDVNGKAYPEAILRNSEVDEFKIIGEMSLVKNRLIYNRIEEAVSNAKSHLIN